MCLDVPAKVVSRADASTVTVDLHGNRVAVSDMLVDALVPGDWVLIHAGFAIQKLSATEAAATWAVLEEVTDVKGS